MSLRDTLIIKLLNFKIIKLSMWEFVYHGR